MSNQLDKIAGGVALNRDIFSMVKNVMENKSEQERFQHMIKLHANTRAGFMVGAPIALQVVFDLMLDPEVAPQTRLMAAFGMLDRAGHSTKTLHESESTRNVSPDVNEMSAEDIATALNRIQSQLEAIRPQATDKA